MGAGPDVLALVRHRPTHVRHKLPTCVRNSDIDAHGEFNQRRLFSNEQILRIVARSRYLVFQCHFYSWLAFQNSDRFTFDLNVPESWSLARLPGLEITDEYVTQN